MSHDRLPVWLHLTNHARVEEDNAHALRDYYMVLEDLPGKDKLPEIKRIRHARNFVSHGNKLYKNTRAFLTNAIGQKVDCYNPREGSHCQLVLEWRNEARKLVESQLDTLLRA